MLQEISYNTAVSYGEALAANGQAIVPREGTILEELVRLSVPPTCVSVTDTAKYGTVLTQVTQGTLDKPSEHSRELDAYVSQLSTLVKQHIGHAKDVVKPLVLELADKYVSYLENNKDKDASEEYAISTLFVPAVLKDSSFLDTLSYYKDRPAVEPSARFDFPVKTDEEVHAMILVGHDRTDKLITEWSTRLPETYLRSLWTLFFTNSVIEEGSGKILPTSYFDLNQLNGFDKANFALAYHLFSRFITNNVQESDFPLNTYKKLALDYQEYSGALLIDAMKRMDIMIRNKILIVSADSQYSKTSKVNGEIYSEWLEKGGSPEIILGHLISGNQPNSMDLIDKNAKEYIRQWNSFTTFYRTRQINQAHEHKKTFLLGAFNMMFSDLSEIEKEYVIKYPDHISKAIEAFRVYLDGLKTEQLLDINQISLYAIAKCRFHYTSSYQILSDIQKASEMNKDMDVREAALLAVINYVADFLAGQMAITADYKV
jgi:hypothetical protein